MTTPHARARYAVSALLAAAAGIGVGHLVAGVVAPEATPVLAVGASVVDATPTPVKEWAISTFGTADKLVLVGSVTIVTLLLAAGVGLLARTHRAAACALLLVLPALALVAALSRPAAASLAALPGLVAMVVCAATFWWLTGALRDQPASGPPATPSIPATPGTPGTPGSQELPESPLDHTAQAPGVASETQRRTFLLGAGATGAVALASGAAGQLLAAGAAAPARALPRVAEPLAALPRGLEATSPGVSALRTPTRDFYRVDTALTVPRVDADGWRLTIDGSVRTRVTVTYAELLAMDLVERDITLNCVSNDVGGPYIGSTRWTGVPVRTLLQRAGVEPGVDQILSTSVDGMTISTPLEALTDDREALLVVGMDGAPLPPRHGYPVRLLTPGLYGFVGATKWLTRLTATTYAARTAYWTERGWATDAPVRTQARIDTPAGLRPLRAGRIAVGGVAWSQAHGGISSVEVRVDDGAWRTATLGPEVGPTYWRQWSLPWDATSGRHELTVRAVDGEGTPQPTDRLAPYPSGAQGLHSVVVLVA